MSQASGINHRSINQGMRKFERSYGIRSRHGDGTYADEPKDRAAAQFRPITLPSVSFLNTEADLTDADYVAGQRALREAGL